MALGRKKLGQELADGENKELEEISFLKQRIHDLEQAVTERNKAIEDLQESLNENLTRYNDLVDHSRCIILEWDTEGNIIFLNKWGLELFGFTMEEIKGRNVVGTIVPAIDRSGKNLVEKMEVVRKNPDGFYSSENENIKKNGESVWINWTNIGILDQAGKLVKTLSIGLDRTLQRQQEVALAQYSTELEMRVSERTKELQDSEMRFRATFEQASVGIAHVSTNGQCLQVNQKLCDILGYSQEELFQLSFHDITHPDDIDIDEASRLQLLKGEIETYHREKRYIRKNKSLVWVNLTTTLVRNSAGDPAYFISVIEDITERKKAGEAIKEERNKLDLVTSQVGIGLAIISKDYHTVWANKLLKNIFGDVQGKLCYLTFNQQPAICPECGVKLVFETGVNQAISEQVGKDAQGKTIWSQIIATPLYD